MNGFTLITLVALAIGIVYAYRAGRIAGRREANPPPQPFSIAVQIEARDSTASAAAGAERPGTATTPDDPRDATLADLRRRLDDAESACARFTGTLADLAAERCELDAFAEDRRVLLSALADARGETARYRQLVVDFETNAPPTLLGGPGSPDDLKLIVGVGPMLERMLQQLGITTFRQIARWSDRDIDEFDAKLAEFPGRIRRDGWVVQARTLHQSKYGERA